MSGEYTQGDVATFQFTAATAEGLRVVLSAGKMAIAGVNDIDDGTAFEAVLTADDYGPVRLKSAEGTVRMIASEAISAGGAVYAAAGGKVAASGGIRLGKNVGGAATANNDVIEVQRDPAVPLPTAYTVTPAADAGAASKIPVGATHVVVAANTNDANDFYELPPIADVPIGHTIRIAINGGANCEMRTPAASGTTINNEDCDGTKEYLCTSTDVVIVTKRSATGWIAQSITSLGAVRTAVVPD
jgi:hypothetical protein